MVCKSWKTGIDKCLDNLGLPKETPHYLIKIESLWNYYVYLRDALCIQRFCISMDVKSNPFVGSALSLKILQPERINDFYYSMVTQLLELYGHYVLHFTVHFENLYDDSYRYFISWLLNVPNIRSLRITGSCYGTNGKSFVTRDFVHLHLPKLQHMRMLDIAFEYLSNDVITALVQKYSNQLQFICVALDTIPQFLHLNFVNLSEIVVYHVYSCIRLMRSVKHYFRSKLVDIKKITIYVDIHLDMNDVFEVLDDLKIPAVELRTEAASKLGLYTSSYFKGNKMLTFLTSLTISDSAELNYKFLDFMNTLLYLCILPLYKDYADNCYRNEMSQRLTCPVDAIILRCLYAGGYPSKFLWDILPKLEVFSVYRQIGNQRHCHHFLRNVCQNFPDIN